MKTNLTLLILMLPLLSRGQDITVDSPKQKGYFNYSSIGTLIGSKGDEKTYITSFLMEHNYQLDKNFALGMVTGVEWLDVAVLPIGANIKLILPKKRQSAFFTGLSAGYAFALQDVEFMDFEVLSTRGGGFFNSEVGYIFPTKNNINLFIAIGYRYHEFEFVREDWVLQEVERKKIYNRFSLRLGVRIF